jgi:hypothetical protein
MVGKNLPFAKPHRHYSHLFAIFPLYEMNVDTDEERIPLMRRSIQHYTDLDGDNCIYKFSGASSLWSAIGEGDSALHWLNRSLELLPRFGIPPQPSRIPTLTPNTFYSERENPTFESPISSSRSMLDMLLQDWGGTIRIFPAMPTEWKDASFYQLSAQGGFLVSAVRENGTTKWIHIKSLAGEPCRLRTGFNAPIQHIGPSTLKLQKNGVVEFQLKKGEELLLYTGSKPIKWSIYDLPLKDQQWNIWGMNH